MCRLAREHRLPCCAGFSLAAQGSHSHPRGDFAPYRVLFSVSCAPPLKAAGGSPAMRPGNLQPEQSLPNPAAQIIQGSSAVFGRRSSASADTGWKSAVGIIRQSSLQPNAQLPIGHGVVFIAEALAAMQTETRKRHPSGIFPEDNAANTRNPIAAP